MSIEDIYKRKLEREIQARKEAESLLEKKSSDLYRALQKQKRLTKDLARSQRLSAIGKMSNLIAHDFNNILAAIKGFATFIKEDLPKDSHLYEYIGKILKSTTMATDMVRNISNYSRNQKYQLSIINICEILEDCVEIFQTNKKDQVNLEIKIKDKDIHVEGNNVQIYEIFMNILNNSFDALFKTEKKIFIKSQIIEEYQLLNNQQSIKDTNSFFKNFKESNFSYCGREIIEEKSLKITIADNGTGIDEDIIQNIFKPYFSKKERGTGLGLFGSEAAINDHLGSLKLISSKDIGTICEIVIPIYEFEEDDPNIKISKELDKKGNTIMIIDDDDMVGGMINESLKREGYNTFYISDEVKALELLDKNPEKYKAIITDEIMPKIRGHEILKKVKKDYDYLDIPVIIYSGLSDDMSEEDFIKNGALAFLNKPVDKNDLIRLLDNISHKKS